MSYNSSVAYDLNNEDFIITGNDFVIVPISRIIWDFNKDTIENAFVVPIEGIYNHDLQVSVKDCINVDFVEIAIFKQIEGEEDDYWFIMDKKAPESSKVHLNGSTQFDLQESDKIVLKIKLHGVDASAKIEGSDDYTAWGFSYVMPLTHEG